MKALSGWARANGELSERLFCRAASCLSIYLMQEGGIHCYGQVRELYLQHGFTFNFWIGISLLFVLSMSIPLAVDKLRLLIFSHVENKVSQLLDKHIFKRFFE